MKNVLIFVFLTLSYHIQAQRFFSYPQTTVNGQTYNCKLGDYKIYVSNANNQFDNVSSNSNSIVLCREFTDDVEDRRRQIKTAFQQVFPESKVRDVFERKGEVKIYFKIDKNGNVLEVMFSFDKDLFITPQEIVLLEAKMKLVKFKEVGSSYLCKDVTTPINYIPMADAVRFKSLYP